MAPLIVSRVKQAASVVTRRELRSRQVGRFRDLFRTLLAPELREIRAVLGSARNQGDMAVIQAWIDDFYPGNELRVAEAVRDEVLSYGTDVATAAADEVEGTVPAEQVEEFAGQYTEGLAARWTRDSVAPVRAILRDEEDLKTRDELLDEQLESWELDRAEWVAAREATQAGGAFSALAYGALGVTIMRWQANPGACDLCQSMDGRVAAIQGAFLSPGETVRSGSDEQGSLRTDTVIRHPPLHGNRGRGGVCECQIVAG